MSLESYIAGRWISPSAPGAALRDATTGEVIAHASTEGIDTSAALEHARTVGGPNLR
jgi:oxepin-CoA hydrolase/3-oxo-5,6-dehydrosuberyl-CoA semialdehyde dehydrogenase